MIEAAAVTGSVPEAPPAGIAGWREWIEGLLLGQDRRTGLTVNPEDPLLAASDLLRGPVGTSADRHDHLRAVLGLAFDRTWALQPAGQTASGGGSSWARAEEELRLLLSHLLAVVGPVEREALPEGAAEQIEEIANHDRDLREHATGERPIEAVARSVLAALHAGSTDWWIEVARTGRAPLQALGALGRRRHPHPEDLRDALDDWLRGSPASEHADSDRRARDLDRTLGVLRREGVPDDWLAGADPRVVGPLPFVR